MQLSLQYSFRLLGLGCVYLSEIPVFLSYKAWLLAKSQTYFPHLVSVQLPWSKNKIPSSLFATLFVFSNFVKLKMTFVEIATKIIKKSFTFIVLRKLPPKETVYMCLQRELLT